jgi:hypothetical protein
MSVPDILTNMDHRIDNMTCTNGAWSDHHPRRWVSYQYVISLGDEGELVIEKYNYHMEITCYPKRGIPRLFKLIIDRLRESNLDVSTYLYTKESDLVRIEI